MMLVSHCSEWSAVQYSTVQYSTVQYSTVQYSTVRYCSVQYYTVQHMAVSAARSKLQYLNLINRMKRDVSITQ